MGQQTTLDEADRTLSPAIHRKRHVTMLIQTRTGAVCREAYLGVYGNDIVARMLSHHV
jgi:hypothetical protein